MQLRHANTIRAQQADQLNMKFQYFQAHVTDRINQASSLGRSRVTMYPDPDLNDVLFDMINELKRLDYHVDVERDKGVDGSYFTLRISW